MNVRVLHIMHLIVWCHVVWWVVELPNVSGYALHVCYVKNGRQREFFDPENGGWLVSVWH